MTARATPRTTSAAEPPVRGARLWIGLVLPPLAWALVGLLGYWIVSLSCTPGRNGLHLDGVGRPALAHAIVAAVGALLAAGALLVVRASWRATTAHRAPSGAAARRASGEIGPDPGTPAAAWGRAHFVAFAGLLASSVFLLGCLYFIVPAFVVPSCSLAH